MIKFEGSDFKVGVSRLSGLARNNVWFAGILIEWVVISNEDTDILISREQLNLK